MREWTRREGWRAEIIDSKEFEDERYLSNPYERCFFCKSNLYTALSRLVHERSCLTGKAYTVVSGANQDDLSEYRPGLEAAEKFGVRHPFIDARIGKEGIREQARLLKLPFAELPASPCLSSRLYTGTRVTAERLRAVERAEKMLREATGIQVLRCRQKDSEIRIEVLAEDKAKLTQPLLDDLKQKLFVWNPEVTSVTVDPRPYSPGRSFCRRPAEGRSIRQGTPA
jgi:uncharacterized protein